MREKSKDSLGISGNHLLDLQLELLSTGGVISLALNDSNSSLFASLWSDEFIFLRY